MPLRRPRPVEAEPANGVYSVVTPSSSSPENGAGGARLGINLFDLQRMPATLRDGLLGGKLALRKDALVIAGDDPDETVVPLTCDLLTAALALDLVRSHDRRHSEDPTRVYLFRKAWTRLPGAAVLTLDRGEGLPVILSPEWFPDSVEVVEPKPLERRAIRF